MNVYMVVATRFTRYLPWLMYDLARAFCIVGPPGGACRWVWALLEFLSLSLPPRVRPTMARVMN